MPFPSHMSMHLHKHPCVSTRVHVHQTPPPNPPSQHCPSECLRHPVALSHTCQIPESPVGTRAQVEEGAGHGARPGIRRACPITTSLTTEPQRHDVGLLDPLVPCPLTESPGGVCVPFGHQGQLVHPQRVGSPEPQSALLAVSGAYPEDRTWVTLGPRPRSSISCPTLDDGLVSQAAHSAYPQPVSELPRGARWGTVGARA